MPNNRRGVLKAQLKRASGNMDSVVHHLGACLGVIAQSIQDLTAEDAEVPAHYIELGENFDTLIDTANSFKSIIDGLEEQI